MVIKKRSKRSRYRGSWTHGGGHKKKRRGAGSRGGRGRGGFGKRGQQRLPTAQKRKEKLGRNDFFRHGIKRKIKTINLEDLNKLVGKGKIKSEGIIDLGDLGYNKLLGSGQIKNKLKIKVDYFSKKAEEKIAQAGGKIIQKKIKEKPKDKDSSADREEKTEQ